MKFLESIKYSLIHLIYKLAKHNYMTIYLIGNGVLLDVNGLFGLIDSILVHRKTCQKSL